MAGLELVPGDKVRLIASPERVGIMGNEYEGSERRRRVLVTFLDGSEKFCLMGALEKIPNGPQSPYEMIIKGRFGGVRHLRGAITYYRLSGRLANLIYSLNTTNTQFLAYQFKPVLKFLESPNGSILIADEVGLGKTIEAGLIWSEARARHDARRLLVICPAMLKEKWKIELSNRFGIKSDIVSAGELCKRLENVQYSPYESFALIVGIQGIRPPKDWDITELNKQSDTARLARFLQSKHLEDALLDMVIIDEAHVLKNQATASHQIVKLIRQVTHNMVMLSATPIQLHNRDLFNLINLLDSDAFPYEQSFESLLKDNKPLIKLRDFILRKGVSQKFFLDSIKEIQTKKMFSGNEQLSYFTNNIPNEEFLSSPKGRAEIADQLDKINPLGNILTRTRKQDVHENRIERVPKVIKARMTEIEYDFYQTVTNKVRQFCQKASISEGFMLTIPQRQISSSMVAACRGWLKRLSNEELEELNYELIDNYDGEDELDQSPMGTLIQQLVSITKSVADEKLLYQNDSKYKALHVNLKKYWKEYPDKKIVLFSFYRNTLHYLSERLAQDGFDSIVVHGGMNKHDIIREFESPNGPRILLSSEVAAEGVDLQFCSLLINYDLPWNPAKIEQRIGRIDRIGQQEKKILIWNFIYENTIDDRVYDRLLSRLDTFSQALGSMGEILGNQIRRLSYDLLSHNLTVEQEEKQIEAVQIAIANNLIQQEQLEEDSANLIAHGEFIQNKVRAARELGRYIRGEDLRSYVIDFLLKNYPGTRVVADDVNSLKMKLHLSVQAQLDFSAYLERYGYRGLTQILSSDLPVIFFDNQLNPVNHDEERIGQDHPLVRFITERYKSLDLNDTFYPVVALLWKRTSFDKDPDFQAGDYVYIVCRWAVTGVRIIEKLVYICQRLSDGVVIEDEIAESLVNSAALNATDWDGASSILQLNQVASIYDNLLEYLDEKFYDFKEGNKRENSDRIQLMINLLIQRKSEKTKAVQDRIDIYNSSLDQNKIKMIPLEKGRLAKEVERIDKKIFELENKIKIASHDSLVSVGVIRVI